MNELTASYLADIASQISFISAVLGAFSAAFLATVLGLLRDEDSRLGTAMIAFSALATTAFIVSTLAAVSTWFAVHPDALEIFNQRPDVARPRNLMTISFGLGIFSMLIAMGLSGWIRSRITGLLTTVIALLGTIGAVLALSNG